MKFIKLLRQPRPINLGIDLSACGRVLRCVTVTHPPQAEHIDISMVGADKFQLSRVLEKRLSIE